MNKHPHIILGCLLGLALALAAFQGDRVQDLRDSDEFYRWLVTASTQIRVFGTITPELEGLSPEEQALYKDEELFAKIDDKANQLLQPLPEDDTDIDDTGTPFPLLVRYTRVLETESERKDEEAVAERRLTAEEQYRRDKAVWDFARSPELKAQREEFLACLSENKLASAGAQIGIPDMYQNREAPVSIGQMFLGFRKMAANLLWLEVDEAFHSGQMQRMIPLMRTTVLLDPNFVDAYLIGAWHLAYNATAAMEDTPERLKMYNPKYGAWMGNKEEYYYSAADFLKNGIKNNPRDYRLYFDLGYSIYELKLQDHINAVKYLKQATTQRHDSWVRRMLYHSMTANGQYEDALAGWLDYLKTDPTNPTAQRFIQVNEGYIRDRELDKAWERLRKAEAEGNQQEIDAARTDKEKLYAEAQKIWKTLVADSAGGDTIAESRLARMEALHSYYDDKEPSIAISLLRNARLENSEFFAEASDLIIRFLQESGGSLNISEKKYLLAKQEAERRRAEKPIIVASRAFELRKGQWHEEGYNDQERVLLTPQSQVFADTLKEHPELEQYIGLGDVVVFNLNDTWYEFNKTLK